MLRLSLRSRTVALCSKLHCRTITSVTEGADGEYTAPIVKTNIPGPKSKELTRRLSKIQQADLVHFFTDFSRSRGNFIADADGNVLLDLFGQLSTLPLGYNHPAIMKAVTRESSVTAIVNRPALGFHPPLDYIQTLEDCFLSVAPSGMSEVAPMMCGSCANENAFKSAIIWYMNKYRDAPLTPDSEEYRTALINQPPGCPKVSILSFMGGFHGRLLGSLSCSHVRPIQKLDVPAFDWPIAPFPQLKYPLEEFVRENEEEERKCLEQVEDEIEKAEKKGVPVAAVAVEPIQAEGGDRHASPFFFKELQKICKKNEVPFIVDEVQTGGGATGYMWAHECWELSEPADYVTFAKKMQVGGFYNSPGRRTVEPDRVTNTWLGDPIKMVILDTVLKEIKKENLLELVRESGRSLLSGLEQLQAKHPSLINSARGMGTFCSIDCCDVDTRNEIIRRLRRKGFQTHSIGTASIRFRPALIFQPKHVFMFLDGLDSVLKEFLHVPSDNN